MGDGWRRLAIILWCLTFAGSPLLAGSTETDALRLEYQELRAKFWQQLDSLPSLPPTFVDRVRPPQDPSRLYLHVAPEYFAAWIPTGRAPASSEVTPAIARDYAAELLRIAQTARKAKDLTWSHQLTHEALACDGRSSIARQVLIGPQSANAPRAQPWDFKPARRAHPRIAWTPRDYQVLQSAHFRISTNDTRENALALATALEQLHIAWHQLFFSMSHEATRRVSPRARPALPHDVVLFRTHDEYVARLRAIEPQIEITRGYYHAPTRTAYFVGGEASNRATWLHEATHQLFHEQPFAEEGIGQTANFWIIEGIALYLETLQTWPGGLTVGGLEADRLQTARFRALRESFYIPAREMVSFDQTRWQHHEQIHALYSQAAGWTHCLMHAQGGSLRHMVPPYLQAIYLRRDQRDSLTELSGKSWTELDEIYHDFLNVTDRDLERLDPAVQPRQLCLGATRVTDGGLRHVDDLSECTWIDLYGLPITDAATQAFARTPQLQQVNLERTQITDATVERLANAQKLQQLDLSHTRVTDASLTAIQRCSQLESLWLTGTLVTDACVEKLRTLAHLKSLDVQATKVSQTALDTLQSQLPDLVIEGRPTPEKRP